MKKLMVALVLLCGCTLSKTYVAADRATFDAIAPEYTAYVSSDVTLDEKQRERRLETVRSWEARLGAAETGGKED